MDIIHICDIEVSKWVVLEGHWTFIGGYLKDDKGEPVLEQEVWVRVNGEPVKGYVTEFSRFRIHFRARPGVYFIQPFIWGYRTVDGTVTIIDGPIVTITVLPNPSGPKMDKQYELRFFKKIDVKEILPQLVWLRDYLRAHYPHVKIYVRSGMVERGYSWHDIDFLADNVRSEEEFRKIYRVFRHTLDVNMDLWIYDEGIRKLKSKRRPTVVVTLDEFIERWL